MIGLSIYIEDDVFVHTMFCDALMATGILTYCAIFTGWYVGADDVPLLVRTCPVDPGFTDWSGHVVVVPPIMVQ